jgi:FkbM family methyltransferase
MKSKFQIDSIYNHKKVLNDNLSLGMGERRYLLFPRDNAVTHSLYQNDLYEPWLYQFLYYNNIDITSTNVVDIGSNNGQIAVEFAHIVGDEGKVFCFEPQRIIFQQLCGNVFFNGLDNVYCWNVAIGDHNGETSVQKIDYHNQDEVNFGDVHIGWETYEEKVDLRTLDSFNLDKVTVIKIDVQGFERQVLLGAKETITKWRPILFIEIEENQLQLYGESSESVIKLLTEWGYTMRRFNDGFPFQTESGLCLDFVGIPNEHLDKRNWKWIFM